ncbi:uncharacterized protein LOC129881943 [Solanum dulcamara]|uniref:uncharacterized protein LOC129881943 n=1 Tax=Solanum dulcamara TaxID=45834 RepID=UPI0024867241|nr:uncharacterized protein LOC129881943 [Solanum dulcamara]
MGSKTFLLIVLAIFLVITSEVAARKLAQSSITSLEKGEALPPIGIEGPIETKGMFQRGGFLGIGAPMEVRGLSGIGGLSEIEASIGFEGHSKSGEFIEIGAPIESGGLP